MTAESELVSQITEASVGATSSKVEIEETVMDKGALVMALPTDPKLEVKEVDAPPKLGGDCNGHTNDHFPNANVDGIDANKADADSGDAQEDTVSSTKDDANNNNVSTPNSPENGMDVGGGDPDQHSYVFVDSQNGGGGGDSSSDWDINEDKEEEEVDVNSTVPLAKVEEEKIVEDVGVDVNSDVPHAKAEVDKVVEGESAEDAETPLTSMSDQCREDIVPPYSVGFSFPHIEEDNQNSTPASLADVASEKEQFTHPVEVEAEAEAPAAVTEEQQLEPHVLVVPDLIREEVVVVDQVESESSLPLCLEVDNQKTTAVAPAAAATATATAMAGDVLQSHEEEEDNDSESITVLELREEGKVPEAVGPQDATDLMLLPVQPKNHLKDSTTTTAHCNKNSSKEEDAQSVLLSEASDIIDSIKGEKSLDGEEAEKMKLQASAAELAEIAGEVSQEESQPETSKCSSLEVEVVDTQTEVEEIPNVQSSLPESTVASVESCQLDNGGMEKLVEERFEVGLGASFKEHDDGPPQSKVDDSLSTRDINQDGNSETPELSHEINISLEPELNFEQVLADSKDSHPTSKPEVEEASVTKGLSGCQIQDVALQNHSSANDNNLHSPDNFMKPETEGDDHLYLVNNTAEVEVTKASNEVYEISKEGKAINSSFTDIKKETCSQPLATGVLIPVVSCHVNSGLVCDAGTSSGGYMISESGSNNSYTNGMNISCTDAAVISQAPVQFGSFVPAIFQVNGDCEDVSDKITCLEVKDFEKVCKSEVSKPLSLPEGLSAHPMVKQTQAVEVESVERPFNFLIRMPKYFDDELNEQIRQASLQLADKTQKRDAIKFKIQMLKANVQQAQSDYTDTISEERAAHRLIRLKRQEIDSVQSVINRVKNAISVEDIDIRIKHMEHMMQHETLPLKEEKQFIREIKQLKHHREQLSCNMGSQDEVQQAFDQRDQIEEKLKVLKKDLDRLKNKVSVAEAAATAAGKRLKAEKKMLEEAYIQHGAANNIRQEAYVKWQNLRRQSDEKNARFWLYKNDVTAAIDYASSGDKGALHCLCLNQVEKMMELWNNDDEFRKEYVRCNTRSTIWRFRTLDGRALGPDEESPVVASFVDERIKSSSHKVRQVKPELPPVSADLEKKEKQLPTTKATAVTEGKSGKTVAEQTNEMEKNKKPGKLAIRNSSPPTNSLVGTVETLEEECNEKQTKEEQAVTRKKEQLRKAEEEAKLKEQRRLEEIAKAKEALERKRKIAEKAQIRAEVRAQREAEQKEKEKEKKAKKKERKKAGAGGGVSDSSLEGGDIIVPTSEVAIGMAGKETETKEGYPPPPTGAAAGSKRPQKAFTKQLNKIKASTSMPPSLRNKNKRRMQQWIWVIVPVVVVVALFFLCNIGFCFYPNHQMGYPGF